MTTHRIPIEPQPPADTAGLVQCDDGTTWMDYPIGGEASALWLRSEWKAPHQPGDRLPGGVVESVGVECVNGI
jgi:hypothetical protein